VAALRRTLLVLAVVAAAWTGLVAFSDGFYLRIGSLRFSSRSPLNPALITLLLAAALALAARRAGGLRAIRDDWARLDYVLGFDVRLFRHTADPLARAAARRIPEIIGLLGAGLYLYHWSIARPLWLDEEMIALNIRDRSFGELAGPLWLGQSAPLGWLIGQRAVMLTLGTGELALRLVPMLFGLATIAAAVWIGRRWLTMFGASVLVSLCTFGLWLSHFPFEVKHYSADAFWGLLLPALAIRVTEGATTRDVTGRAAVWWAAAALGLWTANGALFATPGAAIVMCALLWRRHGWRTAAIAAALGVMWLASFALDYELSLGHTYRSRYLREYWLGDLPPADSGVRQTLAWLFARLETLAIAPFGTDWWRTLWLVAAAGLALGSRPALGLASATAPLMMFLLAGLGVVPLFERLAHWAVPATYVGIALGLDRLWSVARAAVAGRQWVRLAATAGIAAVPLILTAAIVGRGREDMISGRPPTHKQGFQDRDGVRWLVAQRRDGDALVSTHLGWPGIWWYGRASLAGSAVEFEPMPAGAGTFQMDYRGEASVCARDGVRHALKGYKRLLVYIGFRDVPRGFDELLLQRLQQMGTIAALKEFSEYSRGAIVDLRQPRADDLRPVGLGRWPAQEPAVVDGCFTLRAARRW
jgi:hypothetical protein